VKRFGEREPVRIVLPWMPPVTYENPLAWIGTLYNWIDDAHILDFYATRSEFIGDKIAIYVHSERRKNEATKLLRRDKNWAAFSRRFPEAKLEWADDVLEDH